MTWEEHYQLWREGRGSRGQEIQRRMQAARKRVAENSPDDWLWLKASLSEPERKLFVAQVFEYQPVAKRLFAPMLLAGVLERNPSLNRVFIEPCVRSFGSKRVLEELLRYLEFGTDAEKAGAASAFYWARSDPHNEDLREVYLRFCSKMLREFVENTDLQVRRRIIPLLLLNPEIYPEEVRPLVPIAIEIARTHTDEYIRHRVEIQLGAGGLFMAIPDTDASNNKH